LNYDEENSKDPEISLKFSLKDGTYAITKDQTYGYFYDPK